MASDTLLHPPLPAHTYAWKQGHSGQVDEVSIIHTNESGSPAVHLHHDLMEDGVDEDDNIVHILATLEARRLMVSDKAGYPTTHQQLLAREEHESGEEEELFSEWEEDEDEDEDEGQDPDEDDLDDRHPKDSKPPRWSTASNRNFSCSERSFACEKHSKWKKKCPSNCPLRKQQATIHAGSGRKLWTKKESAMLVRWADHLLVATRETDEVWKDIAKTLNRSVNSTKKKFMRLTNKWSRKPSPCSSLPISLRPRSTNTIQLNNSGVGTNRKRGIDETWDDESEYDSDMHEDLMEYSEVRHERRATTVCERHRRWKKRCPADCKDKQDEARGTIKYITGERCRSRPNNRILGVVGRPAVSCRRHQLEHQKCPEDCPRRRTVDQHLQDRARNQKREEGYACPSSLHRSSLHPCSLVPPSDSRHDRGRTQLTEGGYACPSLLHHSPLQPCSSSASVLPFNTGPATSHGTPQNVPKHTSLSYSQLLSLDTYDIQSYHLTGKLPTEELNIGPDTYWHSARDTTPVSNSTTIVLDLHDGGPPQISLSQANFHLGHNELKLETCTATNASTPPLPAHTFVASPNSFWTPSTPSSPFPPSPSQNSYWNPSSPSSPGSPSSSSLYTPNLHPPLSQSSMDGYAAIMQLGASDPHFYSHPQRRSHPASHPHHPSHPAHPPRLSHPASHPHHPSYPPRPSYPSHSYPHLLQ